MFISISALTIIMSPNYFTERNGWSLDIQTWLVAIKTSNTTNSFHLAEENKEDFPHDDVRMHYHAWVYRIVHVL